MFFINCSVRERSFSAHHNDKISIKWRIIYIDSGFIMSRKSVKENKNIYQLAREEAELSREAASAAMQFVTDNRIESFEADKSTPHPEEVLAMADAYKKPELCNYFCSHDCPIGREYVPEVKNAELSQISLEMLVSLNSLNAMKDRLIEITVDGQISNDEINDFVKIENKLDDISEAVSALKLWCQKAVASGKIDEAALESARKTENH